MLAVVNVSPINQHRHATAFSALLGLLLLVPVPSLAVFFAMIYPPTAGTPLGQAIFIAAKAWILLVPVIWWLAGRISADGLRPRVHGLLFGVASGVVIAAAIGVVYVWFGHSLIDIPHIRAASVRNGLHQPNLFLGFALYTIIINAWLEEYVWRWFVYRQCETLIPNVFAVIASALMFTAHHVVALQAQMGWGATLLACTGVFLGGCIWSWCFRRFRSIWPGYLSHVLADIAVFVIGWRLLFGE
jgi:uncharacterized protein